MTTPGLVYEDEARYDGWVRLALGSIIVIMLVAGAAMLFVDITEAYVMLGATVFIGLLFWFILPRRYQVYEDRVSIVLGGPLAWTIPLRDVKTVGLAPKSRGFIYGGVRFVTSLAGIVEITRRNGLDAVFSPLHPELFVEQVERARALLPANPEYAERR